MCNELQRRVESLSMTIRGAQEGTKHVVQRRRRQQQQCEFSNQNDIGDYQNDDVANQIKREYNRSSTLQVIIIIINRTMCSSPLIITVNRAFSRSVDTWKNDWQSRDRVGLFTLESLMDQNSVASNSPDSLQPSDLSATTTTTTTMKATVSTSSKETTVKREAIAERRADHATPAIATVTSSSKGSPTPWQPSLSNEWNSSYR